MNTNQYLSQLRARFAQDSRFHWGRKDEATWPSTNLILMSSYKPHNWHQVLEYGFQELRVAITNKELIKIRYSSWKSSGIKLWSSEKRFHEVQESKFKSSGMGVFTLCSLEDKVQELRKFTTYWRGMSYYVVRVYMDFTSRKLEKISHKTIFSSYLRPDFILAPLNVIASFPRMEKT